MFNLRKLFLPLHFLLFTVMILHDMNRIEHFIFNHMGFLQELNLISTAVSPIFTLVFFKIVNDLIQSFDLSRLDVLCLQWDLCVFEIFNQWNSRN